MAIGKVGSYATTEAPKDPLLDTLQNIEQVGFQKRAEDRAIEDARKKAKKEQEDELAADIAKIKSDTTKYATKNAVIIDTVTKLQQGIAKKAKDYEAGRISKTDYNIYKTNAESQIGLMDQAAKSINKQSTEFATMLEKGLIAPGFEMNALNAGGAYDKNNMMFEVNEDGTITGYLYDNTDPNNPKIIDKNGLANFGQKPFTPVMNYDLDKDKKEFITTYPKVLNEKFVGDTKVGTKGIAPEIEKAIDLKVDAILANKNALAIKAKEITGEANPFVEDEEIINKVRENLKKEFIGMYAKEKMVDEATGRGNLKLARTKAEKEEEKPVYGVVKTPPTYAVAKVTPKKGYETVSITGGKPIQQIQGRRKNKKGQWEEVLINNPYLNSYTVVDSNNGRAIAAEVTSVDFKNSTMTSEEKSSLLAQLETAPTAEAKELILSKATKPVSYKTEVVYLTQKDADKFKGLVGAKNVSEMADRAKVKEEEKKAIQFDSEGNIIE